MRSKAVIILLALLLLGCAFLLLGLYETELFPQAKASPSAVSKVSEPPGRGDRHPRTDLSYPEEAFVQAGGRVIDLTRPPYNAKGDGITDNTRAFVAAYDDLMLRMHEAATGKAMRPGLRPMFFQMEYSPTLYLRNGTYLVSDSIIYSGPPQLTPNRLNEFLARVRFIGQSREGTILKLANRSPGFGPGSLKPVLSYGKYDRNNSPAQNVCRNLTIDTGTGNPGAVGIQFAGANLTEISNVTVRSGDRAGGAGIRFNTEATQGYYHDITVEGFDYGLLMRPYHATQLTFEHVTLRNQVLAGMKTLNSCLTIRDLVSVNSGPALLMDGAGAQAVVLDSWLAGAGGRSGIEVQKGQLFARDIETTGYSSAIRNVPGPKVDEYVSGPVVTLLGKRKGSLRLPVEEPAPVPDPPTSDWANVNSFGAVGDGVTDDSAAVQAAMSSGKPVVYFPSMAYKIGQPINVPATVKKVNFLFGSAGGARFRVAEGSQAPVEFLDGYDISVVHQAARPVILNDLALVIYSRVGTGAGTKLFANNCSGLGGAAANGFHDQQIWFRQVNREVGRDQVNFSGQKVDMWVLGYKCEGGGTNFEVVDQSRLEVLGGLSNESNKDGAWDSTFVARDSQLSVSAHTNFAKRAFRSLFKVTQGSQTVTATYADFVSRGKPQEVIIPLCVSSP